MIVTVFGKIVSDFEIEVDLTEDQISMINNSPFVIKAGTRAHAFLETLNIIDFGSLDVDYEVDYIDPSGEE